MAKEVDAHYDGFSRRYDLATLQLRPYYRRAVAALDPQPGDLVYDLGCGTGLLFPHLVRAVGPTGRVVGVDLSEGMLAIARRRVQHHGWDNVELIRADLTDYRPPEPADRAIFCLALSTIPVYDAILANAVQFVHPGGRIVVADSWKRRERWYRRLSSLLIDLKAPLVAAIPDNQIEASIRRHLIDVTVQETMLGVYHIATARRPPA